MDVKRTGGAKLRLVNGSVPHFEEMVILGREIARCIINEYGNDVFINRLADTHWFSCLACVLGFEWNTSGQTTITLLALKKALNDADLGVVILGGKGDDMRKIPDEINLLGRKVNLESDKRSTLSRSSKFTCKVDNNALQDSYNIYFHSIIVSDTQRWAIVNQGMNLTDNTARRYHWISDNMSVDEPHVSIKSDGSSEIVLDLVSDKSKECRKVCIDILHDQSPRKLQNDLDIIWRNIKGQTSLEKLDAEMIDLCRNIPKHLIPPKKFDQGILMRLKERVDDFGDLLMAERVGPATIRGLAFISSLIYGAHTSWRDPVKYTYAHGTKTGVPYMINRKAMRREAEILKEAIERSKIGDKQKLLAIARLGRYIDMISH